MHLLQTGKAAATKAASLTARLIKVAARQRPLLWPLWQTLPVSGIDIPTAQSWLYALRRALADDEEGANTIQAWLHALQLSQVCSDRLLHAISITQRHLRFWQARLKAGSHTSFLLLGRGPGGFAAAVMERMGLSGNAPSGLTASDKIEERIIALQLLSNQLAEALSGVHRAADALKLAAVTRQHQQQPLQLKPQQLQQQVLEAIYRCLQAEAAALEQLQPAAAQLQEQDLAVRHLSSTALQPSASMRRHQQHTGPPAAAQRGATLPAVQQQVLGFAQLLHVREQELTRVHSADAGAALSAASRLAAELGPLVPVPKWAAMPSSLQRHWIRYTLAAGVGVYGGLFLYRNSRLAGSNNLDKWIATGVQAVEGAWGNHVVSPLLTVRDELFRTFRDRPSIVSNAEFEADKASLLRMLADFEQDHPQVAASLAAVAAGGSSGGSSSGSSGGSSAGAAAAGAAVDTPTELLNIDAVNRGMQVVMQCYEADLQQPIRGLITGDLARTLLIQVQRLKLDTEAAMLELDQILRANELSISLVAAVPALLLSWTLLRGLWVLLLVRAPPDARREATPCRLAMAELERALAALAALQPPQLAATSSSAPPPAPASAASAAVSVAEGMVLYKLFKVYREAQALYRLKDSSSRYSDWPHMQMDLVALVDPTEAPAAKLELHKRMLRTYYVLQP